MQSILPVEFGFCDYLILLMMAVCIFTDIKSRRIYNKVLIPFLVAGLAGNYLSGGLSGLLDSGKGFLAGLAILIIPFLRGGIGGGDVKLLAVIGGIKGPLFVLSTFLAGAPAGGIMALALLISRRRLVRTLAGGMVSATNFLTRYGIAPRLPAGPGEEEEPLHLPYSIAIGVGVAASYAAFLQTVVR